VFSLPWPTLDLGVLALAVVLDLLLGEPPRALHPVVWMGKAIGLLERVGQRRGPAISFLLGVIMALAVPGAFGAAAHFLMLELRQAGPVAYVLGGGVLLKSTFSIRALAKTAGQVRRALEREDVAAARTGLRALVSRDVTSLSPHQAASAAVESVAENTTDSFVAPWLAFALLGVPGAVAYRAINTLDAMIGYHGQYEYLGKASARLDDLVNLAPARVAGVLIVAGAALRGLPAGRAWGTLMGEHGKTESPNAGWSMAAMAGALGVMLEKVGHYRLGEGLPSPGPEQVQRAVQVMYVVAALGLVLCAGLVGVRWALA
jgi:adenosylcobinamide-phosphate synthase